MHTRIFAAASISLIFATAGCNRDSKPDPKAEVERLNVELANAQARLGIAEKSLALREAELAKATEAAEAARALVPANEKAAMMRDAQFKVLQAEVAELKKRDAMIFAEASAMMAKGVTTAALDRYRAFVKDFPNSPLVADANRAIAALTVTSEREARDRVAIIDPKRPQRELLSRFAEGLVTVEEIAPLLKRRTTADVIKLLGPPNKTYRDGRELGYVDKIIDSSTGTKDTLVIILEEGRVTALRIGYQGREIKP